MPLSPLSVSKLIETEALDIIPNATYLRATDVEANISTDNIDLKDQILVLYNNLPDVTGEMSQESSNSLITWPVEINLLCLADMDDDTENADDIQDPLYGYAKKLVMRLSTVTVLPQYLDNWTIGLGETIKIYDKTMTGVMLSFDLLDNEVICDGN